jgi:hypothetical protein
VRKVKQLERQLADARQLSQLEGAAAAGEEGAAEDADRRIRLGRLEGENVLLRSANLVTRIRIVIRGIIDTADIIFDIIES